MGARATATQGPEPQLKALLVEDNAINMRLARHILRRDGFDVIEATNAEDGLVLARGEQPDVILMDLGLPAMDGFEATEIIREDVLLRSIPVVAVTAHSLDSYRSRARKIGFAGYLTKPIDPRRFPDQIRSFMAAGAP